MGTCSSSARGAGGQSGATGGLGDNSKQIDGSEALEDAVDEKSVGKSLYTTGKAQRAYSLKFNDKLKLAEALVAGGVDRSVRGGALGERSIRPDRSVRGGDRSVRGGGVSLAYGVGGGGGGGVAATGEQSCRGNGALYASSAQDRSSRPDRSVRRGGAYTPNQQPTGAVLLAAAAAAGQGLSPAPLTAADYSRQPLQSQQQSSSPHMASEAQIAAESGDSGTARLEGGGDVDGFSPKMYRRQNRSMPASGAGTTAADVGSLVDDMEDVEEHELPGAAATADPGRRAARAVPPRSRSTGTLIAQAQQQAADAGGGSPPSPATPRTAAPALGSRAGSPAVPAASPSGSPSDAFSSYASGPLAGVARMQGVVSRSASGGTQATGSAAAAALAAATASGGRRFLSKSRPQVDLAAQPKRPALKGSPLSGAAHSLFGARDVSMTEVQALPAAAPAPQPMQQQPSGRPGVRPGQPVAAGGLLAGETLSLPTRFSDFKLPTSPGDLEDFNGGRELLQAQQQAAALSTSLGGGAGPQQAAAGAGAAAPAGGRQLQPPASATRLRVQTQGPAAYSVAMAFELLPGSPSASAAGPAVAAAAWQQPQQLISPGQVTSSMLGSPSGSSRRDALSPRASPRASGRVHPAPPAAAALADSPSPSSRLQPSFHRASSNHPPAASSLTGAAAAPQQPLYDGAAASDAGATTAGGLAGGALGLPGGVPDQPE
ncbi:hypothetical protein HXX76_005876 [Chlamydomonas incerta]|uniref:Uncharacterized protein n=1 Tax=Chlamydomonas incerta TaxID=51695 RepID=A0A835T1Q5_CHLIN|nr:hypothetical protein HXX76_005876 [Chlamydomonas incerta]|eukprot:KAG2437213.1 hypothetical protein HXX76_005876 [Chlamydomonas incerta]